jgi:hypothetical protein
MSQDLFVLELTGCSMPADSYLDADERDFVKVQNFFVCYEDLARVRQNMNRAERRHGL